MSTAPSLESGDPMVPVSVRRDFATGVLAGAIATFVAGACLLVSPSFFLTDDNITFFRPGFYEIARLLAHGQFPLLTDRAWNGGALLQDYQCAVLNPVSLLLYVVIAQISDLSAGAAVFSLVHIAILATGVYALCRALGCLPRHALLAGAVAPLSDWIFFWGAVDWIPALVSLAWLAWAWAMLIMAWRRRGWAPAAAIAVALTLLSGWPFTDFALLISALVAARVMFVGGMHGRLKRAVWPALAIAAGGLIAMPAIIPLEIYVRFAQRPQVDNGWAADLTGLFEFGMPFVRVRWGSFLTPVYETIRQPTVYAAWFAPLALAGAPWRSLAADRRIWIVLGSAILLGAFSIISHIGLMRWMFRLLPCYQLLLIVAAAIALTKADEEGKVWSFDNLALVIAAEVWLAFSQTRSLALVYLGVAYAFGVLAWVSSRFGGRRDARWTAMALSVSVGVFALTVWNLAREGYPVYPVTWKPQTAAPMPISAEMAGPERLYIVRFPARPNGPDPDFWARWGIQNTAFYKPGTTISGYTSALSPVYAGLQCVLRIEDYCGDVVSNALAPVAPTGRSLLDLMGVGEVVVQRSADAAAFAARAGGGWARSVGPAGETQFTRASREGQVTWASPGAAGVTRTTALTRLVIDARNDAATPGRLVVARAWYPAWRARLDGAPVAAGPLDGTVIAIALPPKSHGRLVLSFWPSGLTAGLLLAALGAVLSIAGALLPARVEAIADDVERLLTRRRTPKLTSG